MYNLLIVDDEPLILESLYRMLIKKRGEFFHIFKAASGTEALELFREQRIDLLMTDICMPGMDGIALRNQVQQNWADCFTIFLTGQEEFNYAKEAVNENTISFVLKIEGDEMLLNMIDKGYEKLESLYIERGKLLKLNTHFEETLPIIKRDCMKQILYTDQWNDAGKERLNIGLKAVNTRFKEDSNFLLGVAYFEGADRMKQEESRKALEESLRGSFELICASVEENICVILVQDKQLDNRPERLKAFLEIGLNLCQKLNSDKPAIILYDGALLLEELGRGFSSISYKKMEIESIEGICMCGAKDSFSLFSHKKRENRVHIFRAEELSDCLCQGDEKQYFQIIEKLEVWAEAQGDIGYATAFSIVSSQLLWAILNYLPDENDFLKDIRPDKLSNYSLYADFAQAVRYLNQIADEYFDARKSMQKDVKGQLVHQIHRYIDENLQEDLSMVAIGNLVGFNPAYLARVYKEITGISINGYIANQRIGYAKRLLDDVTIKIQKIAEWTGLHTASYFTHYFKKHTGLTPQEYRNKATAQDSEEEGGE